MRAERTVLGPPLRLVALATLLAAVLSGCAGIPTSGPVHQGRDLAVDRDIEVRNVGFAPAPGAPPEAIVRGFLRAMGDFLDDHAIARQYLTPQASQRWEPLSGTSVYDRRPGSTVDVRSDGTVTFEASEVARIGADGLYRRVPPATLVHRTFRLVRAAGEWRIATPPKGLVLSTSDVDVAYRPINLYFLAPTSTMVVPDPILLPNLPGLPAKAVSRLLRGPTTDLRGAVDTAFPQGTQLDVGSVPVRNGLATVNLNQAALQAATDSRASMSAQIVWTLKQLPGIQRIRILADGDDLVTTGVAREQPVTAWSGYDPEAPGSSASCYVVHEGRVSRIANDRVVAVAGAAGAAGAGLRLPAVSLDNEQVAAVSADRRRLLIGRLAANTTLEQAAVTTGQFSAPSWDRSGDLWVVDKATGRLLMRAKRPDRFAEVAVPRLAAGPLTAVRVSHDGSRIALVVGSGETGRLYVGGIVRAASGAVERVSAVYEVRPDLTGVRAVSWADAGGLTVLGRLGDAASAPLQLAVDGFSVDEGVTAQQGLAAVASAPGLPLLAATSSGLVQQWDPSGVGWQPLGPGRDPVYPG